MQMLVSEGNEEIETVENLIFGKTLEMLQRYEDTLKQIGLHVLLSMEGWCQEQRRIIKVGQASILSGDKYEGVIALYPVEDNFVLRNERTREIPCAAVVCCRRERAGDVWEISEDKDSVRKLQGQLEELMEEIKYGGYVQDENETKKIRQDAKKIQIY
ncbi:MAG: hypothetical protein Q4C52_05275 [Eubacteriales bacterium]|nr:hypothetical protein [Eubacteriales bacterium]